MPVDLTGSGARPPGSDTSPDRGARDAGSLSIVRLPFAAGTDAFLARYPFSREIIGPAGTVAIGLFLIYQAAYLLVFVSGEAFWRGYLSFGMERDLGVYALTFMVVPYVLAHYGKPLAESLGAIVAGMTLGWLALKHRSFWLGVAHAAGWAISHGWQHCVELLSFAHDVERL